MRTFLEAKRIIYDGVALGTNPFLRAGFYDAEHQRSLLHGVGARTAATVSRMFPHFMSKLVTSPYRRHGFEVLGIGYHSVVVSNRDDDTVHKFHHRTLDLDQQQKQHYINRLYRKQKILTDFYPEEMIGHQEFVVEPFPLNPSVTAVVSKQPRFHGTFLSRSEALNIPEFRKPSLLMHEQAFTLPDLVGKENIIIPTGQATPVIIDTIPLEKDDPSDFLAYHVAKDIIGISPPANQ